ncbi:MAG TPA: type II toxin-antitoxin system prevent-host-death family antitoxin [Dehalococcoidia bacterium]|nr:type II toxin-antitoxin system prevent-host-death family antitoxin [Dehalococcoidia bacterium]
MKQIGANEARRQLSRLLREVERGETVTITRHGRQVARLVPIEKPKRGVGEVIDAIRESRKGNRLDGLTN